MFVDSAGHVRAVGSHTLVHTRHARRRRHGRRITEQHVNINKYTIPHPTPEDRRGRGAASQPPPSAGDLTGDGVRGIVQPTCCCGYTTAVCTDQGCMHRMFVYAPTFSENAPCQEFLCVLCRKDASVFSSSHKASIAAIDRALPSASCTLIVRTSLDTALEARKLGETKTSRSIAVSSMK